MDWLSIISFLIPVHLSPLKFEVLPAIFFCVIWFLFAWTIFLVHKNAKPENWEINWYGGDTDNTENDLDAEHGSVMEISEAVATPAEKLAEIMPGMILIIGLLGTFLGLGLALDKASTILSAAGPNSMDASMTQLMGMLEGLGTKFKTSTWGLLAFILLRVILSKIGYEEHRLRWSIEKVKCELDIVRQIKLKEDRGNNQKLIDCMQGIATQFANTVQANQEVSRQQLACLVTLNKKSDNFVKVIESQHIEHKLLLEDNIQQSKETRNAMVSFVENNAAAVSTLGKSAAGMSQAASTMGDSANHLQKVIDHFRINMEEVVGIMKKDLNSTISGMNTSFSSNMTNMSENLKVSINDMSGSFKQNMSEMSKGLGTATKDISSAVTSLSTSVDKTMTNVTETINSSMELQTKAQSVFIESTETLNEYINEMTGLVNKLSDDITGGLKAVSESNRNMINLATKTERLTDTVDNAFKESLQSIESVTTLKPALENLTDGINLQTSFLKLISENTSYSADRKQKSSSFLSFTGNKK